MEITEALMTLEEYITQRLRIIIKENDNLPPEIKKNYTTNFYVPLEVKIDDIIDTVSQYFKDQTDFKIDQRDKNKPLQPISFSFKEGSTMKSGTIAVHSAGTYIAIL